MRKYLAWTAGILLVATAAIAGWVYSTVTSLDYVQITDDTWMISGLGGNVAVLRTEAGAVVVDSMATSLQGDRIDKLVTSLTGQPVAVLINTHYHPDHTHGNPAFAGKARIVATERTRELLRSRDGGYWKADAAAALPAETFVEQHEISLGGKTIRLIHPGRAHTDGDLVALFVEERVLVIGDLIFNGYYPNVDLEGGASVAAWPAALDVASKLDFDHVVPGHGPVTDRKGIAAFRAFLVDLWEQTSDAAKRGLSLKQTLDGVELTANAYMKVFTIPFIVRFDRDFVVTRTYEEATGAVTPQKAAAADAP